MIVQSPKTKRKDFTTSKEDNGDKGPTAAQTALGIPEIVEKILSHWPLSAWRFIMRDGNLLYIHRIQCCLGTYRKDSLLFVLLGNLLKANLVFPTNL